MKLCVRPCGVALSRGEIFFSPGKRVAGRVSGPEFQQRQVIKARRPPSEEARAFAAARRQLGLEPGEAAKALGLQPGQVELLEQGELEPEERDGWQRAMQALKELPSSSQARAGDHLGPDRPTRGSLRGDGHHHEPAEGAAAGPNPGQGRQRRLGE